MGSFSLLYWFLGTLIVAIISPIVLTPVALILRRAGLSRWWCILWAIPVVNIIANAGADGRKVIPRRGSAQGGFRSCKVLAMYVRLKPQGRATLR